MRGAGCWAAGGAGLVQIRFTHQHSANQTLEWLHPAFRMIVQQLMDGLTLFHGIVDVAQQEALLQLIETWLELGRSQELGRKKTYQAPPNEWLETGQSRETIQFGMHVKCNKVPCGTSYAVNKQKPHSGLIL